MIGRIVISDVRPQVSCGRWSARAVVGETFPVEATVFREGHDLIGASVLLRAPESGKGGGKARRIPMRSLGLDRYAADVTVDAPGRWSFAIEAFADPIATWQHGIELKHADGQDVSLELEEGALLFEAALSAVPKGVRTAPYRAAFDSAVKALRGADGSSGVDAALEVVLGPEVRDVLVRYPVRHLVTVGDKLSVLVDRPRALYGSWYEFFPRSEGAAEGRSGTFRTAMKRLDAIAAMGFDVVYLPPIHPIGAAYRKGPNNSLEAGPADPGSPWAIGSADGGHDAVHPELGTLSDFDAFVARSRELGMEVALDLALQCSPDHPWVTEHPEWFTTRADGSIAYAENPPKKYQDIYPLDFDNDPQGLYAEVRRVVQHWIDHGVEIFRVDNPHTKPLDFWEWLIADVRALHPDVVFLAEAFTRPPMMQTLAKIGFTQSYTYFTWRNAKWELEEYLRELAHSEVADYMRPNFFVNTPDILHAYLQHGGPPAFKIRAALAATMSPSWGVYSGFELFEGRAVREGSEEYHDSEKYQYRPRDWSAPGLTPYLTRLNEIRRRHPALHWLRNIRFHPTDDDAILAYSKKHGDDVVLCVVNTDPHHARETIVHLDMPELGLEPQESFEVRDEIADTWYVWHGADNYVRLDPGHESAHIFAVTPL
ncbi:MAG TPA: alpha-1,4-glucan--maltose-1-phosphate maltosyltransferase [Mycobacteriales bacterium]|nr:alpha-1,4-glucan--maltose-1-phosphate maltosyltransferase [Mycobacteriales bacterium]